jgi:hypothetical protein
MIPALLYLLPLTAKLLFITGIVEEGNEHL